VTASEGVGEGGVSALHRKESGGVFISQEKSNKTLNDAAAPKPWERNDPRNRGVVADEAGGTGVGFGGSCPKLDIQEMRVAIGIRAAGFRETNGLFA
jgi:hypothetical protein